MAEVATQETVTVIEIPKLKPFEIVKSELTKLADDYRNLVVTEETMVNAKKARMTLRDKRYAIQRVQKENNEQLNELKNQNKANAEELISIIEEVENHIDSGIKAIEDRKAAEKAERERIERERVESIKKKMYDFNQQAINGILNSKTSEEINLLLKITNELPVTQEEYQEFTLEMSADKSIMIRKIEDRAAQIIQEEAERIEQEKQRIALEAREAAAKIEREQLEKEKAEMEAKRIAEENKRNAEAELRRKEEEEKAKQQEEEQRKLKEEQDFIAEEKRKIEAARILNRIKELTNIGLIPNGDSMIYEDVNVHQTEIVVKGENEWIELIEKITPIITSRKEAKAKREEEDRIAYEKEQQRLKEEAKALADVEAEKEVKRQKALIPDRDKLMIVAGKIVMFIDEQLPEMPEGTKQADIIKQVKLNLYGTAEYINEQLNNL